MLQVLSIPVTRFNTNFPQLQNQSLNIKIDYETEHEKKMIFLFLYGSTALNFSNLLMMQFDSLSTSSNPIFF